MNDPTSTTDRATYAELLDALLTAAGTGATPTPSRLTIDDSSIVVQVDGPTAASAWQAWWTTQDATDWWWETFEAAAWLHHKAEATWRGWLVQVLYLTARRPATRRITEAPTLLLIDSDSGLCSVCGGMATVKPEHRRCHAGQAQRYARVMLAAVSELDDDAGEAVAAKLGLHYAGRAVLAGEVDR